jgi:hypothetical protein
MLEQQVRAEMEAQAWRTLREEMAAPPPALAPTAPPANGFDYHRSSSAMLKALVRFGLAGCGAYLGWLAAVDARLGEFEVLLATAAGFAITLALSMFGYARDFVHMLAETARWAIICGVGLGALWLMFQIA